MKAKEESSLATSAIFFLWSADFIIFGHKMVLIFTYYHDRLLPK